MNIEWEQKIISEIRHNPQVFGEIFDAYYLSVNRYVIGRVGDVALAEDIVSETFFKAMKKIHTFHWKGISISHWLYRIASNEIRMLYRKKHSKTESLDELYEMGYTDIKGEQDIVQEIIDAQNMLDRDVSFMKAHKVMKELPLKYQEVLILRFVENKKIKDIAYILEMREGTVKSLISRGLQKIRGKIENSELQPNRGERIV